MERLDALLRRLRGPLFYAGSAREPGKVMTAPSRFRRHG